MTIERSLPLACVVAAALAMVFGLCGCQTVQRTFNSGVTALKRLGPKVASTMKSPGEANSTSTRDALLARAGQPGATDRAGQPRSLGSPNPFAAASPVPPAGDSAAASSPPATAGRSKLRRISATTAWEAADDTAASGPADDATEHAAYPSTGDYPTTGDSQPRTIDAARTVGGAPSADGAWSTGAGRRPAQRRSAEAGAAVRGASVKGGPAIDDPATRDEVPGQADEASGWRTKSRSRATRGAAEEPGEGGPVIDPAAAFGEEGAGDDFLDPAAQPPPNGADGTRVGVEGPSRRDSAQEHTAPALEGPGLLPQAPVPDLKVPGG